MEVKTNIDKNMLAAIESSVESLKKTFPRCHYFAIAEFADFAVENQNYAVTFIDEIFVLRKQKRSQARNTATIFPTDYNLVAAQMDWVIRRLKSYQIATPTLRERMIKGKLIQRVFYND